MATDLEDTYMLQFLFRDRWTDWWSVPVPRRTLDDLGGADAVMRKLRDGILSIGSDGIGEPLRVIVLHPEAAAQLAQAEAREAEA